MTNKLLQPQVEVVWEELMIAIGEATINPHVSAMSVINRRHPDLSGEIRYCFWAILAGFEYNGTEKLFNAGDIDV